MANLPRLGKAGLIWPTLAALVALGMLVSLGTWQLQRKQWKDALIAKMAERTRAPPIEISAGRTLANVSDREYLHVAVTGRLHHDKERYLYAPAPGGLGWHVYTPLEWAPGQFAWINRGFVPDARKDAATRGDGQIPGAVRVTGLIREVPAKGVFTPANDVARNLWYWPDVPAMSDSALPGGQARAGVLPYVIDADRLPEPPGGLPRGGVTRLDLPNRHLEYAITWFGLGLTLIGVYLAFAAGRLRAVRE